MLNELINEKLIESHGTGKNIVYRKFNKRDKTRSDYDKIIRPSYCFESTLLKKKTIRIKLPIFIIRLNVLSI